MAHTNHKESMKCKENLVRKEHGKHTWGTRKFDTSAIVENIVTYLKDNPPSYQGQANGMLELKLKYTKFSMTVCEIYRLFLLQP